MIEIDFLDIVAILVVLSPLLFLIFYNGFNYVEEAIGLKDKNIKYYLLSFVIGLIIVAIISAIAFLVAWSIYRVSTIF